MKYFRGRKDAFYFLLCLFLAVGGYSLHDRLSLDLKLDLLLWNLFLILLHVSVEGGFSFVVLKPGGRGVLFCLKLLSPDC